MQEAVWHNTVLAQSDDCLQVDGYTYFPSHCVNQAYLQPSTTRSVCSWKGEATYFSVACDGKVNADAAWTYANPKHEALELKNRIAFWRGVEVRPAQTSIAHRSKSQSYACQPGGLD